MTRVKICGLSEVEHALAAAHAGADFVGMVFAESRRKVTAEKARDIVQALRSLGQHPETVGVFAGLPATEVNRIADFCLLDRVQLSGGESLQYCLGIRRPVTLSLHIAADTTERSVLETIEELDRVRGQKDILILLDTKVGNASGGTGKKFDWRIARLVAVQRKAMVAGGLDAQNVTTLIREVHPWAVDVSSGTETEGRKDISKIFAFVQAVRKADTIRSTE